MPKINKWTRTDDSSSDGILARWKHDTKSVWLEVARTGYKELEIRVVEPEKRSADALGTPELTILETARTKTTAMEGARNYLKVMDEEMIEKIDKRDFSDL